MVAELLLISNREFRATSTRDGPKKEYKAQHKSIRSKQREEMDAMMKVLIKGGMRARRLPGLIGVRAAGIAETGAIGIMGFVTALDSLGMSMIARQEQHAR